MNGYIGERPYTAAQRQRDADRIREQDDARARSRAAWDRLCGMSAPIGRAVDL